jgi:TolA-binding protein
MIHYGVRNNFRTPMTMAIRHSLIRAPRRLLPVLLLCGTIAGAPALAQKEKKVEDRVERLEKEMQAVQRKVFPGAAGQVVSPDIQPVEAEAQPAGSPASNPLADMTGRVNAIESQQVRLTGQVEESGFRLRQLEEANIKLAAELADLRKQFAALTAPPPAEAAAPATGVPTPAAPARTPAASAAPAAKPDPAAQARLQAVAAIPRASGGSPAQDDYTYGFRLWSAKFYPEAQIQLQAALDKYPNDPVASRTANLLGRAYLDDNKPTQAAKILFENYRARPKGDRAAESLAWVGEALIQLKRPKDACLAYEELAEAFAGTMPVIVRDMMEKGRKTAKCGG